MAFEVLSLDELTDLVIASYANLLPDKNVGRNSDNWKRLRTLAGAVTDLHAHLNAVALDAMPDTATGEELFRWGTIYGLTRNAATPASADNAGRIRGTNGSTWSTSNHLVHKSGLIFRPSAGGTVGASLTAVVGIVGVSTGVATRLKAGEVLTWESTPSGLEDEVELEVELSSAGEDEEDAGRFLVRLLNRIKEKALGGTANDWEQWVLESSAAIATAYIYPNRNGNGSVDVAALKEGSGATRLLDGTERTALLAALNAVRPVTSTARVLEVITQAQDVEVILTPESDASLAKDWDDSTPPEVLAWTSGTRLLQFAAARPASMQAGDRLTIEGTSGVELVVESLSSSDAVILVSAKGQTPVATSEVYAGGPLITPARDAIIALFDSLGPRVGGYGFGNWDGSLRVSTLFEAVQTTEGVLDTELVDPVATVEPATDAYPDDTQVALLVPGNILVRYRP